MLVVITLSTIVTSEELGIVLPSATPSEAQDKKLGLAVEQDCTEVSETAEGLCLGWWR